VHLVGFCYTNSFRLFRTQCLKVAKLADTFRLVNKISGNNKKVFVVLEGLHHWTSCVII